MKAIILYFFLVLSSPFVVLVGSDQFHVSGWLAIGQYDFDIYEGLLRSLYFFSCTFPIIFVIYAYRPSYKVQIIFPMFVTPIRWAPLISFIFIFSLIAFIYDLGITGVETGSGGWHLSGLVHYIKMYLFLAVISLFIFSQKKAPIFVVVLYSIVIGFTASSRFAAIAPLLILMMRLLLESPAKGNKLKILFIMIAVFIMFTVITASRVVILSDGYTFSRLIPLIFEVDFDLSDAIFQGFSQLFLRIGIGRDVILSYEVASTGVCNDLVGLFFRAGTCVDPALDFYGIELESSRFGLSQPMLSSLVVVSNDFFEVFPVVIAYSLLAIIFCKIISLMHYFPLLKYAHMPFYLLLAVFLLIGPIKFAWYMSGFVLILMLLFGVLLKPRGTANN